MSLTNLTDYPNGIKTAATLIDGATFTIGTETDDSINVGIQLTAGGADIEESAVVLAYLSDDSGGDGVCATAPDGDIAVGADGNILGEIVTDKLFVLQSEADGDIDLDIGEAAGGTWYLVVVLPGGSIAVSGAITFAA